KPPCAGVVTAWPATPVMTVLLTVNSTLRYRLKLLSGHSLIACVRSRRECLRNGILETISLASANGLDRVDQVEPADFGRSNERFSITASASGRHITIAYAILVRPSGNHIDESQRFDQIAVEVADGDGGQRSRRSLFRNHEFCGFLTVAGAKGQVKALHRGHGCTVRFCRVESG